MMQTVSRIKVLLMTGLILLLFGCSSNPSNEKESKKDNIITDTTTAPPPPPATPPPGVTMEPVVKKCFLNNRLKHRTVVTIFFGDNEVVGNVTSEQPGSNNKTTEAFEGTTSGDKLTIQFKEASPIIGSDSKWTDKPWTIEKGEKETLVIVIRTRNSQSNKWEDLDYQFIAVDCK